MKVEDLIKALKDADPKADVEFAYQYEVAEGNDSLCNHYEDNSEDVCKIFDNGNRITIYGTSISV